MPGKLVEHADRDRQEDRKPVLALENSGSVAVAVLGVDRRRRSPAVRVSTFSSPI